MKLPVGLSLELWTLLLLPLCDNTQCFANWGSSPESYFPAIHQGPKVSAISHIVRLCGVAQDPQVNKHTYQARHSKDLEPGVKTVPHLGQG